MYFSRRTGFVNRVAYLFLESKIMLKIIFYVNSYGELCYVTLAKDGSSINLELDHCNHHIKLCYQTQDVHENMP